MSNSLPAAWYDAFQPAIDYDDPEQLWPFVRLMGELLATKTLRRDGDCLVNGSGGSVWLSPEDQLLVRRVEDVAVPNDDIDF